MFGEFAGVFDALLDCVCGLVCFFGDGVDLFVEFFLEGDEAAIEEADGLVALVLGLCCAAFDLEHSFFKLGAEGVELVGLLVGLLHCYAGAMLGGLGADVGVFDHVIELRLGRVEDLVHQGFGVAAHGVCAGESLADFVEGFVGAVDALVDHAEHSDAGLESFVECCACFGGAADHFFGVG